MRLLKSIISSILVISVAASPVVQDATGQLATPPGVQLKKVTWNGSGCPVGGGTVCAIFS
jgi:hypothetical protein